MTAPLPKDREHYDPDADWVLRFKADRPAKTVTVAMRERIKLMATECMDDKRIARTTGLNDVRLVAHVRGLIGLSKRRSGGARPTGSSHQSPFGLTKDGQPRQLVPDARIAAAYQGRRYG